MDEFDDDGGISAEITSKHGRSQAPSSKHLMAILQAITEVVRAQDMTPTPVTYFAAICSSLDKPDSKSAAPVAAAMCSLLTTVMARLPNSFLRSKFDMTSALLTEVLSETRGDAAAAKAAIGALSTVLCAMDPQNWPLTARPFSALIAFMGDTRPKVRRRAVEGLLEVLAAVQGTPAGGHASEALMQLSQQVLPGPEAAARAAAAAPAKKRAESEEAITQAVTNALHLLGALRQCVGLMTGSTLPPVVDLLLALYPLKQPLLSRHATDVLGALATSRSSHINAQQLAELLKAVMDSNSVWDTADVDTMTSLIRLVEGGFLQLHEKDPELCSNRVGRGFMVLAAQLGAEADGVRFAAAEALKALLKACMDEDMVSRALTGPSAGKRGTLPAASQVCTALNASLDASHADSWSLSLPVVSELFTSLGAKGAPLVGDLLESVGNILAGDDEEEGLRGIGQTAQATLGAAVAAMGPAAVLEHLPLNIVEVLDGKQPRASLRTWLLPVLRKSVARTGVNFWGDHLLPIARHVGNRAGVAAADPKRQLEAIQLRALELQVWATLPAFCSWAPDLRDALPKHNVTIGTAFLKRPDLRPTISHAICRMAAQTRKACAAHGKQVGFGPPPGTSDEQDDDDAAVADEEAAVHMLVPEGYGAAQAAASLATLRSQAASWFQSLLPVFVDSDPGERTAVAEAIAAYASIAEPALVADFFKKAMGKLGKILQDEKSSNPENPVLEGGVDEASRKCTFMDLCLYLAPGINAKGMATLFRIVKLSMDAKESNVQKKAYKMMKYLCESRPDFLKQGLQEVLEILVGGQTSSLSAAKRYRLSCCKPVIALLWKGGDDLPAEIRNDSARKKLVASMIAEIMLCVKEVNNKTRTAAYNLLVDVAKHMHEADPPRSTHVSAAVAAWASGGGAGEAMDEGEGAGAPSLDPESGLHQCFTMVIAGLAGADAGMISASVMALARLLYEFAPSLGAYAKELLDTILLLLRSKAREIIKATLGFLKVVALRLPVPIIKGSLPQIMEGMLLWVGDSKNRFRLKIRQIMERLAKRCGFDAIEPLVPEGTEERKVLANLRKEAGRKARRRADARAAAAGGSEAASMDDDARSRATSGARTARASEWGKTAIFSDEDDGPRTVAGKTVKTGKTGASRRAAGAGGNLMASEAEGDGILDLMDVSTSRALSRSAASTAAARRGGDLEDIDEGAPLERDASGRAVFREEEEEHFNKNTYKGKKRRRDADYDSDDSDYEDLKGIGGLDRAIAAANKSENIAKYAKSMALTQKTGRTGRAASQGGRSAGTAKTGKTGKTNMTRVHSGERFKSKKGAGGDVKSTGKVEPYAYWTFDKKMLNRRSAKRRDASGTLDRVVNAAPVGAAKGRAARKAQGKRLKREHDASK